MDITSMTEKEKMRAGLLFDGLDEELYRERQKARKLVEELNVLDSDNIERRNELIRVLMGDIGDDFFMEPPFRCDYGYNIHIGRKFYSNFNLVILDGAPVIIGDNVFIAPNVGLYTAGHPLDAAQRNRNIEFAMPITIGNNVWIGGSVVVNPGVTIVDNTVIGSGSVVSKDIPSGVIAAGNPCRVIREITEADSTRYGMEPAR